MFVRAIQLLQQRIERVVMVRHYTDFIAHCHLLTSYAR